MMIVNVLLNKQFSFIVLHLKISVASLCIDKQMDIIIKSCETDEQNGISNHFAVALQLIGSFWTFHMNENYCANSFVLYTGSCANKLYFHFWYNF